MKKTIAIIMAVCMILGMSVFPVMADEVNPVGEWYFVSGSQGGVELDASIAASMGFNMTLVFNEDGTASMNMNNDATEGKWSPDGTMTFEDSIIPFEIKDGILTFERAGSVLNYSQTPPEIKEAVLTPVVENPTLADFNGTWNASLYYAMGLQFPVKLTGADFSFRIEDGKAAYTEIVYDMNNNYEVTNTIEHEFEAKLEDDGTLFVDFAGEEVLAKLAPGASGMILTLHEEGIIAAHIPELDQLMAMSGESQNSAAEAAEGAEAPAAEAAEGEEVPAAEAADGEEAPQVTLEGESSGDSSGDSAGSSGESSKEVYILLEKAE